ncbi:MAG TPA: ASPIC/UnbV domain-containing protein, partial [Acetobacteraceae bacterium]|nr:ASPIC/UnbV domain-containing protein [Acetobacteraceae bacterium]
LLRNDTVTANHGITIRLAGTKSNRDGIGAKVQIQAGGTRQRTEVRGDGSYISHSDIRAHFGLGTARTVDRLEIRWPSGIVDTASKLQADRFYVAREGQGVQPEPARSGRAGQ